MRPRRALVAALGVAVLLSAVGGGATGGATRAENGTDATTIRVSGAGDVEADPNQAVLEVAVVQTADDADAVRRGLAANVSEMRRALREANVSDDQVRTTRFDIGEDRDETGEPAGYQGLHAFEITLNDTSRVGAIIDVAVENGANRVDGVAFTLSEERRNELRAAALREAVTNARADADAVAASADLAITGVRTLSTVESGVAPVRTDVGGVAANAAKTDVESGPVTVSVQVVVTYEAGQEEKSAAA
ncbi:SIMPL domain-containing protein [Halomicrococcus sp. NG-SE-24]|uniref:SIMPL domain-containing protein n=1 Tax=Halomicrococcus sp. NG-SE-24 TaxID=3436928 RepID=UPI003D98F965